MKNAKKQVLVKTGNKLYCYKYTYRADYSYIQMSLLPQLEFETNKVKLKLRSVEEEYVMR